MQTERILSVQSKQDETLSRVSALQKAHPCIRTTGSFCRLLTLVT